MSPLTQQTQVRSEKRMGLGSRGGADGGGAIPMVGSYLIDQALAVMEYSCGKRAQNLIDLLRRPLTSY